MFNAVPSLYLAEYTHSAYRCARDYIELSRLRLTARELPPDRQLCRRADANPPRVPSMSETILVVDDEPEIREFARDALQFLGYTVIDTGDPQHA